MQKKEEKEGEEETRKRRGERSNIIRKGRKHKWRKRN